VICGLGLAIQMIGDIEPTLFPCLVCSQIACYTKMQQSKLWHTNAVRRIKYSTSSSAYSDLITGGIPGFWQSAVKSAALWRLRRASSRSSSPATQISSVFIRFWVCREIRSTYTRLGCLKSQFEKMQQDRGINVGPIWPRATPCCINELKC
jgi:hypothetical protein